MKLDVRAEPRWVNEARFGYNRLYQPTFTNDHGSDIASAYGLNTGVSNSLYGGLPRINVFPFYIFPQELGGFNWPKVQGPDTRFQFIDHISYTMGKNAIKFGGELHHDAFSGGAYGGSRGRIKFVGGSFEGGNSSGIEDYFAGLPTNGTLLVGDPTRHIHNWGYAGFVQDDYRMTPNVTINFGLRYEVNTVIKEQHNLLGNFDPAKGMVQVGQAGVSGPYSPDRNNFAPRFGFAWDIGGNGRTVLRAGGGIMYETVNWESFLALNNSLGLATVPTGAQIDAAGGTSGGNIATAVAFFPGSSLNWNGTLFPGNNTVDCDPVTGGPCTIMGVDRNLRTPYVSNWTVNLQHSFTSNLVLEVAYVGNHGSSLVGIRDINQVDPNSAAEIACGHCEQAGRPLNSQFPYLAQVFQMGNIYRSNYNGLQTTLTSRNYHGLSMVAGYTYSHALDQVGANWDFGAGLGLPTDSTQPGREYASSDFDIRHRLTVSLNYLLPGRKGFAQMLEGWQLNSIISLYGAQPWGVMDAGTDASLTGELNDRWNFYGNPKDFKSTPSGLPFFAGSGDPTNPTTNSTCNSQALSLDGGVVGGPTSGELAAFGCYANGKSFMIPPTPGTFGTMGRNIFRDTGFRNVDLSLAKNFKWGERFGAQFRAEFFNIFNHPNFANPFGGQNGYAHNDPSGGGGFFGCGCATPDVAAANPVIGSGGSRAIQLGLKLTFLVRGPSPALGSNLDSAPKLFLESIAPTSVRRKVKSVFTQMRSGVSFVFLVLFAITVGMRPVARAEEHPERTIEEIKTEAVHRAEVGQYPLIGLDPADVKEAIASIHTRDNDEWAASFMRVADRYMNEAKSLEKSDPPKANADYVRAWRLYSFGRWPIPASPGKQRSYEKAIEAFLAHARFWDPPLEVVRIPFEGKEIIGYLRLPKNANGPVPLVLAVNGLDSRKEDFAESFSAILPFGVGYLAVDGPGTGQNPIKVSENAERMLSRVLDYIATRPEIDKNRVAMHGVSWGAYWATKMAIVESARLRGASAQSPPTDRFFQKDFLMNSLDRQPGIFIRSGPCA